MFIFIFFLDRDRIRQLITTMPHPDRANTLNWKLKYFYDSCMALDNIETDGGRPLNRIITELGKSRGVSGGPTKTRGIVSVCAHRLVLNLYAL